MTQRRTAQEKEYDEICASTEPMELPERGTYNYETPLQRLFAVTTIAASPRFGRKRTPVICTSFARAREIVETNEGDIYECSYRLVVIEEFCADSLYGMDEDDTPEPREQWYRWERAHNKYVPIKKPEAYKGIIGFGYG